jgi:long-subunit acyl-CoA synthetase (AMP-forming)
MLSHKNMIAQCQQLKDVAGSDKKRFLAGLPLFHSKNVHANSSSAVAILMKYQLVDLCASSTGLSLVMTNVSCSRSSL